MNYSFLKISKIFFMLYYIIKITKCRNIASISSFFKLICWYGAYAIGNVIHVKTVGQLEIIASMLVAKFHLKEKNTIKESLGIILIIF
jgi:uncharacterized membrane protein